MPFELKNTGAIYKHAMNTIFHDIYVRQWNVTSTIVKSHNKGDHLTDLKKVFDIMWAHQLKINPTKSFLGVASGRFFWVHHDIQRNSSRPWKDLHHQRDAPSEESQRIQRITKTIDLHLKIYSKSLRTLLALYQVDEEGASFIWDNACQQVFEEIKEYLTHSPVLVAQVSEKLFLIYVRAMDHFLGGLLAQNNDQGHEQVIYYLSRTMIGDKHRYNLRERMSSSGLCHPKDVTLLSGSMHSRRL